MLSFRLLTLLTAIAACNAFHATPLAGSRSCAATRAAVTTPTRMSEGDEAPPPAAEEEAAAPPAAPPPAQDPYAPPDKFLGVFDTTTPEGALGASLIVSGLFGVLVEGVKFLDPNNVGDESIFGSITTIGL